MANPTLSVPAYPNVPNYPGVPPVNRDPNAGIIAALAAIVVADVLSVFDKKWGIYDKTGKTEVLKPDTFLGLEYRTERRISNYPVQDGGFASYNKVNDPFVGVVKMAKSGSFQDRKEFLDKIASLADDTNLYTIVTPEVVYKNCNLERYDYQRQIRNGAGIIIVSCHFVEIRQAEEISLTNGSPSPTAVQSPSAAAPVSQNQVNPQDATSQQAGQL